MELRRIVAIIRGSALEQVEEALKQLGVKGITVSPVKGYGEYANLYKADWMVNNARVEVFANQVEVDTIVTTILDTAHSGTPGDGLVAVMPVEKLYRVRTKTEFEPGEI
jgi:nitrogen regulatory protein P-II 1